MTIMVPASQTRHRSFEPAALIPSSLPHTRQIVIIHSVPFIRLGLASLVAEALSFAADAIYAFATFTDAETRLLDTDKGDVLILDVEAWLCLSDPSHKAALQELKSRGAFIGLIASEKQAGLAGIEMQDLSGLIAPHAELGDVLAMIEDLAASRRHSHQGAPKKTVPPYSLTQRQLKILELMAAGLSNNQISTKLGIHVGTVKSHVSIIFKKMGCHQRTQAIVAFIQNA